MGAPAKKTNADYSELLAKLHDIPTLPVVAMKVNELINDPNSSSADIADVLKKANWTGWAMNEEEREDGSKQGLAVIRPAFQSLKGAFSA